jgi:hypothetical protein
MPDRTRRVTSIAAAGVALAAVAALGGSSTSGRAQSTVGFSPPVFVDSSKAGGEPLILHSTKYGTLVYSSHEGTTHLDRSGAVGTSFVDFLCPHATSPDPSMCPYPNHVWIWTSGDHGKTWQPADQGRIFTGFSDPDLTEDAGGNIYDTGIDLVNDSVYSSPDGGKSWPTGTTQCNEGDRPWLAGGKSGEVFMETDDQLDGNHTLYHSSNAAASCDGNGLDSNGIADVGTLPDGTRWSGFGKGIYDHFDGSFIEPAQFHNKNGTFGVGISRLANASSAFPAATAKFQPVEVVKDTSVVSPFGAPNVISMDSAENIYFAWDTDDRQAGTTGGCSLIPNVSGGPTGSPTPLPNHIMLAVGVHDGPGHWNFLPPISLAHQGNARVEWPWSVAGSPGNLSVVWYQMDQLVDPDCDGINGTSYPDVKTYIYEAHITNATDPTMRQITVTNASGRFIHQGGICNSGTTCAATGQDRRLGDYFTNAIDANGCVIIASGDTTVLDALGQPRITSLPIFISQNAGPSLTGKDCAVTASTAGTPTPTPASGVNAASQPGLSNTSSSATPSAPAALAVVAAGAGVVALGTARRRRRRSRPPREAGSTG